MRACLLVLFACAARAELPGYFRGEMEAVLATSDGAALGSLQGRAVLNVVQQVKRVLGADPARDLNVSAIRDLSDAALLRLALQAVLGNFTSGQGPGWQQPWVVLVDPSTGELVARWGGGDVDLALRVLVLVLCAVHFARWLDDERQRAPRP